jgi:hypothetical protein
MAMRDELIRDLDAVEDVMIYAAENMNQTGMPRTKVREYNAIYWLAKAVYDLLKREIWRGKHG